ncbi:hypothetical protein B0F90DRAFT_1631463 [Multifurca ochricompacta]|uniref:Uncharacterized protein n=1 Tax=Multifurca ochricompacta TaxID=376703 RepID=A0AAD4M4Q0_9AGAM|nr:hypothetical protein B0F90DRAFT_1631463 [Multifurca ochricompacta]
MAASESQIDPLAVYAAYSFSNDQSYQAGLSTLCSGGAINDLSDEAKEDFLRRSRVFYFNQSHGCNISEFDAKEVEVSFSAERARAHSATEATTQNLSSSSADLETPRSLTFGELQTLIEQGKTDEIPNNKLIPDALNDAPPSQSSTPQRKKPWEVPKVQEVE